MDARGVDLEVAYVNIVLDACREEPQAERPSPAENHPAGSRPPVAAMLWKFFDEVNLQDICLRKFKVLQSCPVQLKGRYRQACRVALEALHIAVMEHDETRELRAWKLFSVLPFWLFLRPGSQGRVGRDELLRRFNLFEEGHWDRLHAEATQVPQHLPSKRTLTPDTGAALAPGTQETLHELQHRRPQVQQRVVPEEILEHEPEQPASLDRSTFLASLRSAILLDDTDTTELLMSACERLGECKIPVDIRNATMGPG